MSNHFNRYLVSDNPSAGNGRKVSAQRDQEERVVFSRRSRIKFNRQDGVSFQTHHCFPQVVNVDSQPDFIFFLGISFHFVFIEHLVSFDRTVESKQDRNLFSWFYEMDMS